MQPTLVRFSPDVLAFIKEEATRAGVSVAQYVRDATLARASHAAGQRGDPIPLGSTTSSDGGKPPATPEGKLAQLRSTVASLQAENQALRAEARQAARHATHEIAEARRTRGGPPGDIGAAATSRPPPTSAALLASWTISDIAMPSAVDAASN